jgi:hypothetical protein
MTTQPRAVLGALGILGSLLWLSLNTFLSPDWGPPGSDRYLGYETVNRLWAPAFALILCGYLGLYASRPIGASRPGRVGFRLIVGGLAAMISGNIAEFWFFTDQPYGALNARSLSWIGVLLGWLGMLVGLALWALAGWRRGSLPRWGAGLFFVALPASLILIFTAVEWLGLPFVLVGVAAGALAAWPGAARAARLKAT